MELAMLVGMLVIGAGLVFYALFYRQSESTDLVERRVSGRSVDSMEKQELVRRGKTSASFKLLEKAAPMLSRPVMPKSENQTSSLRLRLAGAGLRQESAVPVFLASKTLAAMAMAGVGLMFAIQLNRPPMSMFGYVAFGFGMGFMLPEAWLHVTRKQRMECIRNGLPDALDLMVVSVEAGLGLDAAIMRVGDELQLAHPQLSEELQICTVEVQLGVARGEALQKMAARSNVEEMKSLVAVVVQAEKLGTSIAKALKTQAESLRTKRRQRAEERAQKTAVKLMLPLVLFIFPAILIVLGVPAGI